MYETIEEYRSRLEKWIEEHEQNKKSKIIHQDNRIIVLSERATRQPFDKPVDHHGD